MQAPLSSVIICIDNQTISCHSGHFLISWTGRRRGVVGHQWLTSGQTQDRTRFSVDIYWSSPRWRYPQVTFGRSLSSNPTTFRNIFLWPSRRLCSHWEECIKIPFWGSIDKGFCLSPVVLSFLWHQYSFQKLSKVRVTTEKFSVPGRHIRTRQL